MWWPPWEIESRHKGSRMLPFKRQEKLTKLCSSMISGQKSLKVKLLPIIYKIEVEQALIWKNTTKKSDDKVGR